MEKIGIIILICLIVVIFLLPRVSFAGQYKEKSTVLQPGFKDGMAKPVFPCIPVTKD